MNLSYRKLNEFLTKEEKQFYLNLSKSEGWINHKSTKTGISSVLYFLPCKYKNYDRVALMKMKPNAIQEWHVDGNRKCVIIYPLSDNYANGVVKGNNLVESYEGVVLLDVTKDHAVFNNNHTRINLQISFDKDIDEVWRSLKL